MNHVSKVGQCHFQFETPKEPYHLMSYGLERSRRVIPRELPRKRIYKLFPSMTEKADLVGYIVPLGY